MGLALPGEFPGTDDRSTRFIGAPKGFTLRHKSAEQAQVTDPDLSRFPVQPKFRFTPEQLGVTVEDYAKAEELGDDQDAFIRAEDVAMRRLMHDGDVTGVDRVLAINKVAFLAAGLNMELLAVETSRG